jgi:F420-dependent oxidoreductase-like protein
MKIAFHYADFTRRGGVEDFAPDLAAAAIAADEGGAATFTLMDHYFQMERMRTAHDPMLEGYTSLGYVAGITSRIQLGLLVTGVTYRHPGLLAKIVTTLDVLSEGRALFGIGAAWYEREHNALGVPYPPLGERFERMEETIQICDQMWREDEGPYKGKHYELAETICYPPPIQQPRPPILIGGSGEQKTLKFVARYADACNLFALDPDVLPHKLDVLRGHCEDEGRDYDSIQKTLLGVAEDPLGDTDNFLKRAEGFAALGFDQLWLTNRDVDEPGPWITQVLEKVGPKLAELGPA